MAINDSYNVTTYKLRAGPPMPTKSAGAFVVHTFMVEKGRTEILQCTTSLPSSSDFRGQGGSLMSANFSRLAIEGGTIFQGKKIYNPVFVDEDQLPS